MFSCLFFDCFYIDLDCLKYLIENNLKVNKENREGKTPLYLACEVGNAEIVKILLQQNAEVNQACGRGAVTYPPMFIAATQGNGEVVQLLLENKAEVKGSSPYNSPLYWAAQHPEEEQAKKILQLIKEKGADINQSYEEREGRTTLLQKSIQEGELQVVKNLVSAGANINALTDPEENILHFSIKQLKLAKNQEQKEKISQIILYLLQEGAQQDLKIQQRKISAIDVAEREGIYEGYIKVFNKYERGCTLKMVGVEIIPDYFS